MDKKSERLKGDPASKYPPVNNLLKMLHLFPKKGDFHPFHQATSALCMRKLPMLVYPFNNYQGHRLLGKDIQILRYLYPDCLNGLRSL